MTLSCKQCRTPYEVVRGRKPSVTQFREFGCPAYVHETANNRLGKFNAKSEPGSPVSYTKGVAFRFLMNDNRVLETKDVLFDENIMRDIHCEAADNKKEFDLENPEILLGDAVHNPDANDDHDAHESQDSIE